MEPIKTPHRSREDDVRTLRKAIDRHNYPTKAKNIFEQVIRIYISEKERIVNEYRNKNHAYIKRKLVEKIAKKIDGRNKRHIGMILDDVMEFENTEEEKKLYLSIMTGYASSRKKKFAPVYGNPNDLKPSAVYAETTINFFLLNGLEKEIIKYGKRLGIDKKTIERLKRKQPTREDRTNLRRFGRSPELRDLLSNTLLNNNH